MWSFQVTRTGASGATRAPSVIRKRKLGPAEATFSAGGQISLLVRNSGCRQLEKRVRIKWHFFIFAKERLHLQEVKLQRITFQ